MVVLAPHQTWDMLGLVRVYTKKRGHPPDFEDPVVLTGGRYGITVEGACMQIHRTLVDEFHYALVWGSSTKHNPQVRCLGAFGCFWVLVYQLPV